MKCVRSEIKPHWGKLWGQKHWCTPAYCGTVQGNGRQVVWLKTGDSRPDYYILRIDSKTNIDDENFDAEILLCGVEDNYGNHDDFEQQNFDGETMVRERYAEKNEPWLPFEACMFPRLSTGNGYWWGKVKTF